MNEIRESSKAIKKLCKKARQMQREGNFINPSNFDSSSEYISSLDSKSKKSSVIVPVSEI